jgi:hypothetical protein
MTLQKLGRISRHKERLLIWRMNVELARTGRFVFRVYMLPDAVFLKDFTMWRTFKAYVRSPLTGVYLIWGTDSRGYPVNHNHAFRTSTRSDSVQGIAAFFIG